MSTYWTTGLRDLYRACVYKNVNGAGWSEVISPVSSGRKGTSVLALRSDFVLVAFSRTLSAGNPAVIYKTEDEGESWSLWHELDVGTSDFQTVTSILGFSDTSIFFASRDEAGVGDGAVWHWDGVSVSKIADATTFGMTAPEFQPASLGGVSENNLWMSDPGNSPGLFMNHWNGYTWDIRDNISGTISVGPRCIFAVSPVEVYVLGDGVYRWNGALWSLEDSPSFDVQAGIFASSQDDIHVVGGYVPPKNVLWASAKDGPMAYSLDGGVSWTEVSTTAITFTVWSVGAWSPKTDLRVYAQFDESEGIWSWNPDDNWEHEYGTHSVDLYSSNPQTNAVWCSEDDTVVVAIDLAVIRHRIGPRGTSWTVNDYEHVYSPTWDATFWDVHGLPDGSAVYTAITDEFGPPTHSVHLLKLSGGVWTPTVIRTVIDPDDVQITHIRAVSEAEVWLAGWEQIGLDEYYKIWKWDGAVLTEEWASAPNEGRGAEPSAMAALHMAEDGSEGWAIFRTIPGVNQAKYLRYNGTVWYTALVADYALEPQSITQVDGDQNSTRIFFENGQVVGYNGSGPFHLLSSWTTMTPAPVGSDALTLRYFNVPGTAI